MKKIRWLLIFWLFTLFWIGSSFGAWVNNSISVFHLNWLSNVILNSSYWQASNNSKSVTFWYWYSSYFSWGRAGPSNLISSFSSFESPLLSTTYYLKYWLNINNWSLFTLTWSYLNSSSWFNDFILIDNSLSEELGSFSIDYNNFEDFYPFVFDLDYNYFTLVDNEIIFNWEIFWSFDFWTLSYCFYWINWDFSCVYNTSSNINFVHFNYNTSDEYWYLFTWYLVQPLNFLDSNNYFFWTSTLLISLDSQERVIYNIVDVYSDNPVSLSAWNIIDKWYIDIWSLSFSNRYFLSSNSLWNFSEIYENSWVFYFRSNLIQKHNTTATTYTQYCRENLLNCFLWTWLSLVSHESAPIINLLWSSHSSWFDSFYWDSTSNLYVNCMSDNPPDYCFDTEWNLQIDFLQNCFATFDNVNQKTYYFCNLWWILQQVEFINYWSWVSISSCASWNCSSYFWIYDRWYDEEYFENYLNSTWLLFKCPRPYDNKLTLRPSLITLLNWTDILLPINCSIAWFSYWKNILNFENSWHFVQNWPLLNFEWDNWTLLYYFFDILISIWIIIFVWKIFYLFHK